MKFRRINTNLLPLNRSSISQRANVIYWSYSAKCAFYGVFHCRIEPRRPFLHSCFSLYHNVNLHRSKRLYPIDSKSGNGGTRIQKQWYRWSMPWRWSQTPNLNESAEKQQVNSLYQLGTRVWPDSPIHSGKLRTTFSVFERIRRHRSITVFDMTSSLH